MKSTRASASRSPVRAARVVALAFALASCSRVIGEGSYAPFPDAGADTELPDQLLGPPEVCNFRDDNLDGFVDEGFAWTVGTWHDVAALDRADAVEATRLPSGAVAVAIRGMSGGEDGVSVSILDATGALQKGPVSLPANGTLASFGIASTWDGTIGVATGSDDGAGCVNGCPIVLTRFDAALSQIDSGPIAFDKLPQAVAFMPHGLLDLAATSAGFVALAIDDSARARLAWVDQTMGDFPNPWNGVLAGFTPAGGSLAWGPALGWTAIGTTEGGEVQVLFGCSSAGGYTQLAPPAPVAGSPGGGAPTLAPHARAIAWLGGDPVIIVTKPDSDGSVSPALYEMSVETGKIVRGMGLGTTGRAGSSVVDVGGNLVATTTGNGDFDLRRFGPSLAPADAPDQPLVVSGASEHALVGGDEQAPLLIRVGVDRTEVTAAALACR